MILTCTGTVVGQQLPKLNDLAVRAYVNYDQVSNIYTFRYSVSNGVTSQGSIARIDIDISTDSTKQTLDTVGLRYANQVIEDFFRRSYPTYKIVPVGFPIVPIGFLASATAARTASFFCAPVVFPGITRDSIVVTSNGIPGLRRYVAEPYIPDSLLDLILPNLEDTSASALTDEQSDSIWQSLSAIGWTLGPVAIDTPFVSINFLDTIKAYVSESLTLNWISDQATATKYIALIDSAQANLAAGPKRRGVAKTKLDSMLVNVYPDSAAGLLTSEAYALLRFNTEYVLKKLREEEGDH